MGLASQVAALLQDLLMDPLRLLCNLVKKRWMLAALPLIALYTAQPRQGCQAVRGLGCQRQGLPCLLSTAAVLPLHLHNSC